MSDFKISKSIYKNIFLQTFKDDKLKFFDIRAKGGDPNSDNMAVNSKFFALPISGPGGPVTVISLADTGKKGVLPVLEGHSMSITDVRFSPFNDHLLATTSQDGLIALWNVPEGGLTETIREPQQKLLGHYKKVLKLLFHPCASNVMGSSSNDKTIKLWDIEKQEASISIDAGFIPHDFDYNIDGSVIVAAGKDKTINLFDTRSGEKVATTPGFEGAKPVRVTYCKRQNKIIAVGYGKRADARIRTYDPAKMDETWQKDELDRESGNYLPHFDEDTGVYMLARKGGSSIRLFELTSAGLQLTGAQKKVQTGSPFSGMAALPKVCIDSDNHEIIKLVQLSINTVQPLSIRVPRKSPQFQADIYPDTFDVQPTLTAAEFFGGESKEPNLVSMVPDKRPKTETVFATFKPKYEIKSNDKPKELSAEEKELAALKQQVADLTKENETLKARVAELESSA